MSDMTGKIKSLENAQRTMKLNSYVYTDNLSKKLINFNEEIHFNTLNDSIKSNKNGGYINSLILNKTRNALKKTGYNDKILIKNLSKLEQNEIISNNIIKNMDINNIESKNEEKMDELNDSQNNSENKKLIETALNNIKKDNDILRQKITEMKSSLNVKNKKVKQNRFRAKFLSNNNDKKYVNKLKDIFISELNNINDKYNDNINELQNLFEKYYMNYPDKIIPINNGDSNLSATNIFKKMDELNNQINNILKKLRFI